MTAPWGPYFRERLRWRLFAPVVLMLTFAGGWVSNALGAWAWGQAAVLMVLLVVQFRLWDDLSDRDRDCITHPNRVLVRADARPFQRLAFVLAAAGLAAAWGIGGRVPFLALTGLNLTFAALYKWIRPQLHETVWRFPVLLAKYPAFIAVVAVSIGNPAKGRLILAALLTYGAAHAYEALHSGPTSATHFLPDKLKSRRPSP